jgi:hypothetical protein
MEYVEKVALSPLKREMRKEAFSEMKKKISENETNEEIYSSLISLLKMILCCGVGVEPGNGFNSFYDLMRESGMPEMIGKKAKEIVFCEEKKKKSEMSECERDMILGYSFWMKQREIRKEELLKLWKCLMLIVKEGISKERKKEEREGLIGLRTLCENDGFYFFLLSLFFLFSPHFYWFFFFSFNFIIFLENRWILRDSLVVSEVKEIRKEYKKEIERRGKGEIVKRKVDKISFVCLLQIELKLMKEEEEKKKFVKNNLVPVLSFFLSGEEKEREEEDSNEADVENAIVFLFCCDYLLPNDSFRPLLLSDERKVLLNKTLLFSLRRDCPFTRRECLNVLNLLFYYGREEEVKFVMREGGMKCVVLKMKEKGERGVKENGKITLRDCFSCVKASRPPIIPYRKKEGWKGEEIMREMMWMMEEEDVDETLIMSYPYGIDNRDVPSFNYGLGMCLHVK